MKKLAIIIGILFCTLASKAQEPWSVTLNIYGSYNFQDKVNLDDYYAIVNEGFQYGAGSEFFLVRNKSIELKYLRMDTEMPLFNKAGNQLNGGTDKGSVNYLLIGGNNYFGSNIDAKVLPFVGADIGIGIIDGQKSASTKFAWDAKLGIKIQTSDVMTLKLNVYIQSIISTFGSDYWVYPTGVVVDYTGYGNLFQFGVGCSICVDFNKKQ